MRVDAAILAELIFIASTALASYLGPITSIVVTSNLDAKASAELASESHAAASVVLASNYDSREIKDRCSFDGKINYFLGQA